jgi:hypothetical protein
MENVADMELLAVVYRSFLPLSIDKHAHTVNLCLTRIATVFQPCGRMVGRARRSCNPNAYVHYLCWTRAILIPIPLFVTAVKFVDKGRGKWDNEFE